MARVRFFASAREATGVSEAEFEGATVGEIVDAAVTRYGDPLERLLSVCGIWVNGETAHADTPVAAADEVAVLPPVSGGGFDR